MQFYCPNCQQTVEANPESVITTKFGQTAYKAHCNVCGKDMAVYGKQVEVETNQENNANS